MATAVLIFKLPGDAGSVFAALGCIVRVAMSVRTSGDSYAKIKVQRHS